MKKYIRGWRRRRVSETEGPKGPTGKSPYITPLLRRNASVRRSPGCREVSPTGEARSEGNGGEGGRGDVSRGSGVAVVEAFDEGTRGDVVVGLPRVGPVVEPFPFDWVPTPPGAGGGVSLATGKTAWRAWRDGGSLSLYAPFPTCRSMTYGPRRR